MKASLNLIGAFRTPQSPDASVFQKQTVSVVELSILVNACVHTGGGCNTSPVCLWSVAAPAIHRPLEKIHRTSIFAGYTMHKFSTKQVVRDGKLGTKTTIQLTFKIKSLMAYHISLLGQYTPLPEEIKSYPKHAKLITI